MEDQTTKQFRAIHNSGKHRLLQMIARSDIALVAQAIHQATKDEGERRGIELLATALGVEIRWAP